MQQPRARMRKTGEQSSSLHVARAAAMRQPSWTTGVGIVLALVPLPIWASAALGSIAAVLSLVFVARARSLGLVK
jgi:hypothetical protein